MFKLLYLTVNILDTRENSNMGIGLTKPYWIGFWTTWHDASHNLYSYGFISHHMLNIHSVNVPLWNLEALALITLESPHQLHRRTEKLGFEEIEPVAAGFSCPPIVVGMVSRFQKIRID